LKSLSLNTKKKPYACGPVCRRHILFQKENNNSRIDFECTVFITCYNNITHTAKVTNYRIIQFQYFSLKHSNLFPPDTCCFTKHSYTILYIPHSIRVTAILHILTYCTIQFKQEGIVPNGDISASVALYVGSSLPTFRDSESVPSSRVKHSVHSYKHKLCNIPEERRLKYSQILNTNHH
jgi:hypothetical protein